MDKIAKYKSAINFFNLIYSITGIYIFIIITTPYFTSILDRIIIYTVSVLLFYTALYFQVNNFYFFEDRIEIHYFFRLLNKVKIHTFDEIESVRYYHTDTGYMPPTIQLIFTNKKRKTILPSNSFSVRYFKKRKAILKYIDDKGIPIEIKSNFESDEDILV